MIAKALTWLFGNAEPIEITSYIAVICASLVILSAGILGYTALFDLFNSIGLFHPALAIFFPLLFDFAEITAAVIVLNAKLQDEDDDLAWKAVLLFTALGIIANIAHVLYAYFDGRINAGQGVLAVFATALFPISVALVTHLLKSVIARQIARNKAIKTLNTLLEEITEKRNQSTQLDEQVTHHKRAIIDKQAEVEQLNEELAQLKTAIEQLKVMHQKAQQGELAASKAEQQAYQLDGLLAAGKTLTAACEMVGISPNTARKRLQMLNGQGLSQDRES